MNVRRIATIDGPLNVVLEAVPSKSMSHRALIVSALAEGVSELYGPLDADDTRVTRDGLIALGVTIESRPDRWIVHGQSGAIPGGGRLDLRDSGSSMRFLAAVAALGARPSRLDGSARLRERPVSDLAEALRQLGAAIAPEGPASGLPLIAGGSPFGGGAVSLSGRRSSQFASALLLIAPALRDGLDLTVERPAVSLPYVDSTAEVLSDFGARISRPVKCRWRVEAGGLTGREYRIEGDHSSASYFLSAAAVVGGRVRVERLLPSSPQPDAMLRTILRELGCGVSTGADWIEVRGTGRLPGFDLDLNASPDLAPTLAVLALFAEGPCTLRGIAHLRHKESDRLELLAANLRSLGREAIVIEDRIAVGPRPARLTGGTIATASDHRMAMAFAVAGLRLDGMAVEDPDCVSKSNPVFWEQFERLSSQNW